MIKLSDYVFQFLQEKGVQYAFMLPGGGAMHLDDSFGRSGMQYFCTMHEQAAAVAAGASSVCCLQRWSSPCPARGTSPLPKSRTASLSAS